MTAVGLGLATVGVVLVLAGVRGVDPRDMLITAFQGGSAFGDLGDRAAGALTDAATVAGTRTDVPRVW